MVSRDIKKSKSKWNLLKGFWVAACKIVQRSHMHTFLTSLQFKHDSNLFQNRCGGSAIFRVAGPAAPLEMQHIGPTAALSLGPSTQFSSSKVLNSPSFFLHSGCAVSVILRSENTAYLPYDMNLIDYDMLTLVKIFLDASLKWQFE